MLAKNWLNEQYKATFAAVTMFDGRDNVTYYAPPNGLNVTPNERFVTLADAQRGTTNGNYAPNAKPIAALTFPITSLIGIEAFVTKSERDAAKSDADDAPADDAPAAAPKRRRKAADDAPVAAPKRKKASATSNKKAHTAASRKLKKAHPGASQDVISTFLAEASAAGHTTAAAIFAAAVVGVCKSQVHTQWQEVYVDVDEGIEPVELSADEWETIWAKLDADDTDYADFDAVWSAVDALVFE